MGDTAVPAVIDYLVNTIRGLPECANPCLVTDGWAGTYQPQLMVCVGGGPEDDEQNVTRKFAAMGMGPNNLQEDFDVLIYVRAWTGGTDQKPSRDSAYTVVKAIEKAIRADMSLGATVAPFPAILSSSSLRQTAAGNAAGGRAAEVRLVLFIQNRI